MTDHEWPTRAASTRTKFEACRDLSIPLPANVSPSDVCRRRFFAGDTLTAAGIAEEFQVSTAFLAQQISLMRKIGYEFEMARLDEDNPHSARSYRLLNPEHEPDWSVELPSQSRSRGAKKSTGKKLSEHPDAKRKRESRALARARAEKTQTNGHRPQAHHPELPRLGDAVEISLLALGNDGDVRVGIRQNGQSWLLRLEGATSE